MDLVVRETTTTASTRSRIPTNTNESEIISDNLQDKGDEEEKDDEKGAQTVPPAQAMAFPL